VNFAFCSCSESETLPPTIATTPITEKTQTTAKSGGDITDNGGSKVSASGVCWNTSSNPTISDNVTNDGIIKGSFTSSLVGLAENTIYYYRAYATNGNGTSYGVELSFYTGKGILDQQQPDYSYGFAVNQRERWQSFIPTLKNISTVELRLKAINPTGNFTVSIQNDTGHGMITYTKQTYDASSLPSYTWLQIEIIPPIPTSPDANYRITITRSDTASRENAIVWRGAIESEYPGYCNVDPDQFESHWDNYDYAFKTYGF